MDAFMFPGGVLRDKRKELKLSLDEVYRKTRIPIRSLEALEEGDLGRLPAPCYAIGFLKSYCQFLELDPSSLVDSYKAMTRPPTRFLGMSRSNVERPGGPRWFSDVVTWGAVCLLLALGWLTYAVVLRPTADVEERSVEAGALDMVVPNASGEIDY